MSTCHRENLKGIKQHSLEFLHAKYIGQIMTTTDWPYLNRGVGVYGGGCQLRPFVRSFVRAEAVARAAGVGVVPVLVAWWERR